MEKANGIWSMCIAIFTYLLGGIDNTIKIFFILLIIDYITGILKAIYNKKLNSTIGVKGIVKKVVYICIVALATQIDLILGSTGAIRTIILYFFIANEGLSIIENAGKMGIKLPKKLTDVLEQLKKEE